jgi:hypothetical protein
MFVTDFTLSGFCGLLPGLSGENCELLLRNYQYVISGNYVAVVFVCVRLRACVRYLGEKEIRLSWFHI